jgi:hypothetical protein
MLLTGTEMNMNPIRFFETAPSALADVLAASCISAAVFVVPPDTHNECVPPRRQRPNLKPACAVDADAYRAGPLA